MKRILLISIAATISVILSVAGGMALSSHEIQAPERLTVIEKNLTSPTLKELGQKAGDPSTVQGPVEPLLFGERKGQWI
jgi:hypothetical protein